MFEKYTYVEYLGNLADPGTRVKTFLEQKGSIRNYTGALPFASIPTSPAISSDIEQYVLFHRKLALFRTLSDRKLIMENEFTVFLRCREKSVY